MQTRAKGKPRSFATVSRPGKNGREPSVAQDDRAYRNSPAEAGPSFDMRLSHRYGAMRSVRVSVWKEAWSRKLNHGPEFPFGKVFFVPLAKSSQEL